MKQGSFNQTAYRIFLLLTWLIQGSMTFETIIQKFKQESITDKNLSQDTLWLYVNTLKALGCQISRPSPKNAFCYCLTYHPFSYILTETDFALLHECLAMVEDTLGYQNIFYLNLWIKRIIDYAANPDKAALLEKHFPKLSGLNFEHVESLIHQFQTFCTQNQLIHVQYLSPVKGIRLIEFLPEKLFYYQGYFYVSGNRPNYESATMLRLDRIKGFQTLNDTEVYQKLLNKRENKTLYFIRLLSCAIEHYPTLGEDGEEICEDPYHPENLLIKVKTDNDFLLTQRLLSCGYSFQILYPTWFRDKMRYNFSSMRQYYL